MKNWKLWLPDVVVVLLFVVISFAYFFPADIEGRVLYRHDSSAGRGAGQEAVEYQQRTGERTRWTNALFGGMPTYQMSPSYPSTSLLSKVETVYHLGLPENVWYVFVYLLGFYILLRAFDFRVYLAALGAVIWAFSSYFFIIIAAGHIWKVMALAYLPPMIAGVVLAYRGKYLWGMLVTPRTDDLLLPVHRVGDGHRLLHRRNTQETIPASRKGYGCVSGGWCHRCLYQHIESLPYVGVWSGVHAW